MLSRKASIRATTGQSMRDHDLEVMITICRKHEERGILSSSGASVRLQLGAMAWGREARGGRVSVRREQCVRRLLAHRGDTAVPRPRDLARLVRSSVLPCSFADHLFLHPMTTYCTPTHPTTLSHPLAFTSCLRWLILMFLPGSAASQRLVCTR